MASWPSRLPRGAGAVVVTAIVVVGVGAAEWSVQATITRLAPTMIVPMARPTTAGSVEGGRRGRIGRVSELLYLRDAYLRSFRATVVDEAAGAVALDRTAFYPTGGGQPHDPGILGGAPVVDVRKDGDVVWHHLDGAAPAVGTEVDGEIDWDRRHALMRTHTALHGRCGGVWKEGGGL